MSGFKDAGIAIENRLKTNWATTPVRYENVPFTETNAPYLALYVRDGQGAQISLGSPAVRRWPGVIVIYVLVPERSTTQLARQYADAVSAIFDRVDFSHGASGTIFCRTPSIEMIGVRDGWLQVNVNIPFHRDKQY